MDWASEDNQLMTGPGSNGNQSLFPSDFRKCKWNGDRDWLPWSPGPVDTLKLQWKCYIRKKPICCHYVSCIQEYAWGWISLHFEAMSLSRSIDSFHVRIMNFHDCGTPHTCCSHLKEFPVPHSHGQATEPSHTQQSMKKHFAHANKELWHYYVKHVAHTLLHT